jgi:2-methylcitrate dehydratase PrpD
MKNKKSKTSGARREFLKTATLGVGAAAVAGTLLKGDDAKAKTPLKSLEGAGYSETEHVKKYYELARM